MISRLLQTLIMPSFLLFVPSHSIYDVANMLATSTCFFLSHTFLCSSLVELMIQFITIIIIKTSAALSKNVFCKTKLGRYILN